MRSLGHPVSLVLCASLLGVARWILGAMLRPDDHEFIRGDLDEELRKRVRDVDPDGGQPSRIRDALWYLKQAVQAAVQRRGRADREQRRDAPSPGRGLPYKFLSPYDLRLAVRYFRDHPAWTLAAVATLATGIAMATVALGLVDQALWRPLDFPDAGSLVTVYETTPGDRQVRTISYPRYLRYRERVAGTLDLAALVRIQATVVGSEGTRRAWAELVSGNFFRVLHVQADRGRTLLPSDDRIGGESRHVVVVSHSHWRQQLGADEDVVGKDIVINGHPFTIVGVAPAAFRGIWESVTPELWIPLAAQPEALPTPGYDLLSATEVPWIQTVGRLGHPNGGSRAQAMLRAVAAADTSPMEDPTAPSWLPTVYPGRYLRYWPPYRDDITSFMGILSAMAWLGLAACCVNLAILLVAKASGQARELAIQAALGASRAQIARRLTLEAVILTASGGAVGLAVAWWLGPLTTHLPLPVPVDLQLAPSIRLGAVAIGVALVASLALAGACAWHAARQDLRASLHATGRHTTGSDGTRRSLLAAQVATASLLVVVAGLLLRSSARVASVDPGFTAADVVMTGAHVPPSTYDPGVDPRTGHRLYRHLQARLGREPGVASTALAWDIPLDQLRPEVGYEIRRGEAGAPDAAGTAAGRVQYNVVSPGYFEMLGMRLGRGRGFSLRDDDSSQPVAIVNRAFERELSGEATALGTGIRLEHESEWRTVVGIVDDIKYNSLTESATPLLYVPLSQQWRSEVWILLRTRQDRAQVLARVRELVREADAGIALSEGERMPAHLGEAGHRSRVMAWLSGVLACLALGLSLVGVYGLTAHVLRTTRWELGVRAALGATPNELLRHVVGLGLVPILMGAVLGLLAELATSGLLASLLFQVDPHDPAILSASLLIVVLACIASSLLVARRVKAIHPAAILRDRW